MIVPCEPEPPELPLARPVRDAERRRSTATDLGTRLTWPWLATQLLPSPELAFSSGGAPRFGLRWQVTPFLYSFGVDRRVSPFRAFVVEPLLRTSGSLELFVSPEYLSLDGGISDRFGFRSGVRAYFPMIEKGDYLSVSLGTAYVRFGEQESVSYQFGAYILFGFLGFEQSFLPGLGAARFVSTLQLRFF